jgi:hypothetical protein
MGWCVYPHTAPLLGAAVLQLHPLQLKLGKGQPDTGPCSRWETKKTSGDTSKGAREGVRGVVVVVGTGEEVFPWQSRKKKGGEDPEFSQASKGAKSFRPHHTRAPPPSRNSRPGFPTCRMLMPRERKGERDGTGLERDSGQRWEGMERGGDRIAWQPSRGTCTGDIIPGHLEHRPLTPTRAKKLLAG